MRYPVTISPDDGQFTISFPDVPEAVTFGETRAEALQRAPDALLTIFDAFMKDRRDIPAPSQATGYAIELPVLESVKIELYRAMRASHIGKAELARRLDWHLPQVDRVLQVRHASQLDQMEAAFAALGKKLVLTVVEGDEMNANTRRKRAERSHVRPGVLARHARAVPAHAARSLPAGRRVRLQKAAKKR